MARARRLSVGFERADVELLAQKLRRIFEEKRKYLQVSLDGTIVEKPIPVLNVFGRLIRGVPVDPSKLRVLEPLPHRKLALAVDASVKVVFNLGAAVVVESKVAALAFRGERRIWEGRAKRVALAASKFEVAEWLTRVEYEAALAALSELGGSGYLLLDRSLICSPLYRLSTRELVRKVERRALALGLIMVGVPKRTRLALDTGGGALGYIANMAARTLNGVAWYYYPLFREESLPPWMLGTPALAKLSELSDGVLRVDVLRRALARVECSEALEELAALQDLSLPGYPYPLRAAHEESRVGHSELDEDRIVLTESLREFGVSDRLLLEAAAYSIKEKSVWGDGP